MSDISMASCSAPLLFPPFEKGGQGGFAFRARAEQMPEQIPLDPPFSKGESRAAESGAAKCRAAKHCYAKRSAAKLDITKHHSANCWTAKHHAAKHRDAKHYAAAFFLCESSLFPPLKKGGRGDLLFVSEQSKTQSKSPLIPLFQRGKVMARRSVL
jgi:hypothetical protein